MSRFRSEKGDAILVTTILSIVMVFLVASLTMDTVVNTYIKQGFTSIAQDSVERSVSTVSLRGSLTEKSVQSVVDSYKDSRMTAEFAPMLSDTTCNTIEIGTTRSNGNYYITSKGDKQLPYMTITLSTQRSAGKPAQHVTYSSEGYGAPVLQSGIYNPNLKYTVVSANIYDASPNTAPSFSKLAPNTGKDGDYRSSSCQYYNNNVSAITFASLVDIAN